ncbi:site-specific integrase [Clostridium sp. AWRP]|uniref:tyrosine-type recombinase/integrase n=1 Tax=Clostridium sp. AWRP TaxID=2212991 RepID=UPI000FD89BB4|nr:site-specific integrase [Clostridium sp. AWRP]AZV58385.1 site-specific integrase [Clostridium sp. AWRP]
MATKTNCVRNGKKYYRLRVDLGRDSDGKRIRKTFYGKSKKEAEDKLEEYKNGLNSGLSNDYDKLTVGNVCKLWLFEKIKNTVKPSTFERYEGIYRLYIKPSPLYPIKLKDIKGLDIQRYYNNLIAIGKSTNVVKNLNKLLKSFFNYCIAEGYMIRNYCMGKSITLPEDNSVREEETVNDITIFTLDEQSQFIKAIEHNRLKALFLLALGTGLREGELLGLKWSDIDFINSTVSVKRSLKSVYLFDGAKKHYELIEQSPKTKNSIRTVPIPENLIPVLKKRELEQKEEKLKAGSAYTENNYIFSTPLGTPTGPENLRKMYSKILSKNNIPHKKFHSLRHTYATRLFEKGVPIKTVQTLLGHSDISTTANIYTHVMPEQKIEAVDKINSLFNIE